jgi:serine/threonine-protein kinase
MTLASGARIGPYEIASAIGRGGMGEVYRAVDTNLGRNVAVKVLPGEFAQDRERLARFEREARTLAALNHPNIAAVFGLERAGQQAALVMELVEGEDLSDRLARGAVPVAEALPLARQLADALQAAHDQGIVHRDLKPANIKLRSDGTVKVLDFGLAKSQDQGGDQAHDGLSRSPTITSPAITQAGILLGTAAYMSPEQARGRPVDRRADIWAFGCVLYEMLSGRRAFDGDDVTVTLARIVEREPDFGALPADVPERVRRAIRLCLKKDPQRRASAVHDVWLALEGAFETAPVPTPDTAARRRLIPALAAAIVPALAAGMVIGSLLWRDSPAPRVVTRFEHVLPAGLQAMSPGRALLAVSPDGRRFVFNATDGLYFRSFDEPEGRLLKTGSADTRTNPFFSPDGSWVGFFQSGQLRRINVRGGAPVDIAPASSPYGVSWAPDDSIFYAQPEGILRVSAFGGTPHVVVRAGNGERMDGPQLLPDGVSLLFSVIDRQLSSRGSNVWDAAKIVAQSLESGVRTVLVDGGGDPRYVATGHLVYAVSDGLFAVPFDANAVAVRGGVVSVIQGVRRANAAALSGSGSANYALSDDGTLFFLAGTDIARPNALTWVDRSGRSEPILAIRPDLFDTPRLAADDERLLVVALGDARIYDLATGRELRLTSDRSVLTYAAWSPDGKWVAYSSTRTGKGGRVNVWVQRSDGAGDAAQVTFLAGETHLDAWAPDGRMLAVHHHPAAGSTDIFMIPIDGQHASEPQPFLTSAFSEEAAAFSPDGRYVAYASTETGRNEIYVRPLRGQGSRTTVSVDGGVEPVWATNGELFYRNHENYALTAVSIETREALRVGTPSILFRGPAFPGGSARARYSVSSDGRKFIMSAGLVGSGESSSTQRPLIHIIQNWTEELKRLAPLQ